MTKQDMQFWKNVLAQAGQGAIEAWIKELHPHSTDLRFEDEGECGVYTWLDGTHWCSLWLDEPPGDLVIRLWRESELHRISRPQQL